MRWRALLGFSPYPADAPMRPAPLTCISLMATHISSHVAMSSMTKPWGSDRCPSGCRDLERGIWRFSDSSLGMAEEKEGGWKFFGRGVASASFSHWEEYRHGPSFPSLGVQNIG